MPVITQLRSKLISALASCTFIPSCKQEKSSTNGWTEGKVEALLTEVFKNTLEQIESNEPLPVIPTDRKAFIERISRQAMSSITEQNELALTNTIHQMLLQRDDPIVSINGKLLRKSEVKHLINVISVAAEIYQ